MVVRDLTKQSLGNSSGVYTRVYTVFLFEAPHGEDLTKFIIFSSLLVQLSIFMPALELADMIGSGLSLVLTQALPPGSAGERHVTRGELVELRPHRLRYSLSCRRQQRSPPPRPSWWDTPASSC